jgi:DNA-binding IclR family transcriptional regulator
LEKLANRTEETVNLSVPRQGAAVAIFQIDPPNALSVDWVGRVLPPHTTSDGKIYLAWLPDDEVNAFLAVKLERYTPTTITAARKLRTHLKEVRHYGVAYTLGELDLGMNGVSSAVLDTGGSLLAMVSVSGSSHRLTTKRLNEILSLLNETVADIRYALGDRFVLNRQ